VVLVSYWRFFDFFWRILGSGWFFLVVVVSWRFLVVLGNFWWFLVFSELLLVVLGGLWWVLVFFGGSW
jgi:hypothetical protein